MSAGFGFAVLLLGTVLAGLGLAVPRFVAILEFAGGLLVVVGLAVIGRALALLPM